MINDGGKNSYNSHLRFSEKRRKIQIYLIRMFNSKHHSVIYLILGLFDRFLDKKRFILIFKIMKYYFFSFNKYRFVDN